MIERKYMSIVKLNELFKQKYKLKYRKRIIVVTSVVLALLILLFFAFDTRLKTVIYTVDTEKLTHSVRLALITDLHACSYGNEQETLINAIDKQDPDVVLLGGDIFDDAISYDNAEVLLKVISKKYPCYYVTGNHEYWSNDISRILDIVQSYGIAVLDGAVETLDIRGQFINICGVDDPEAKEYTGTNYGILEQLKKIGTASENGYYTVLLAHRPELVNTYLKYGFDIILSGHAHGGQWRIPGLLNGLLAPNQGFLPKYAGGRYDFNSRTMIVSRGLARETTRIPRIFNRPELVFVNLK